MKNTNNRILEWFLLGFQADSNLEGPPCSDAYARIRDLSRKKIHLYGSNEKAVVVNLLEDLKHELNQVHDILRTNIPILSTLRTDAKSLETVLMKLNSFVGGENIFNHSIEEIEDFLNEVNDLLVTPLILTHNDKDKHAVEYISYSNSGLTRITYNMCEQFKNNENLRTIDLSNNFIRNVPKECLRNLKNVSFISLKGNRLTRLTRDMFKGSNLLETIVLDGNAIGYVHPSNNDILKKTNNSNLFLTNSVSLKKTYLYSVIQNHAAKASASVVFVLSVSIVSYITLLPMFLSVFVGFGLALAAFQQTNKWVDSFDKWRDSKGLQPDCINQDVKSMGKDSSERLVSEALNWLSPKAYTHYDSYCFGLREQEHASFKNKVCFGPKFPRL